jgi:hypothetical protein
MPHLCHFVQCTVQRTHHHPLTQPATGNIVLAVTYYCAVEEEAKDPLAPHSCPGCQTSRFTQPCLLLLLGLGAVMCGSSLRHEGFIRQLGSYLSFGGEQLVNSPEGMTPTNNLALSTDW